MKRTYYKLFLKLRSPLSLGSGISDSTDHDALRDNRGTPYIPATSIAGVIRHSLDDETGKKLFGSIEDTAHASSPVITYGAVCTGESVISVRDSVCLKDDDKTAADTGKFDFEIVETGAEFVGYIELIDCDDEADQAILDALRKINLGLLRFGHKTSRGYGIVEVSCQRMEFTDISEWLDFDMFDGACWSGAETPELKPSDDVTRITLSLKQHGALSIRSYVTGPLTDGKGERKECNESILPDYRQLSLENDTPVIPGTSWAGAFRTRFRDFTDCDTRDELFGYIEKNKKNAQNHKSRIYFSESRIRKCTSKIITRNSIDRFTCGTNDGALYTEQTIYNGEAELEILLIEKPSQKSASALMAVIADLDNGFLAVGGLTAVGRGLFEVTKLCVNGVDKTEDFKSYRFNDILEVRGDV